MQTLGRGVTPTTLPPLPASHPSATQRAEALQEDWVPLENTQAVSLLVPLKRCKSGPHNMRPTEVLRTQQDLKANNVTDRWEVASVLSCRGCSQLAPSLLLALWGHLAGIPDWPFILRSPDRPSPTRCSARLGSACKRPHLHTVGRTSGIEALPSVSY